MKLLSILLTLVLTGNTALANQNLVTNLNNIAAEANKAYTEFNLKNKAIMEYQPPSLTNTDSYRNMVKAQQKLEEVNSRTTEHLYDQFQPTNTAVYNPPTAKERLNNLRKVPTVYVDPTTYNFQLQATQGVIIPSIQKTGFGTGNYCVQTVGNKQCFHYNLNSCQQAAASVGGTCVLK